MASVNLSIVAGYLGDSPKVAMTKTGKKVARFSVATTERGFQKQDGTVIPDKTEWHNVVLWGRLAETAEKYLHKGSSVYVQGKMRTRSYEAQDGSKRYITEIEGEVMQMLDTAPNSQNTQENIANTSGYGGYPTPESKDDLPF